MLAPFFSGPKARVGQIVIAEDLAVLIIANVGQLLILVGFLVHGP